jgi:hypothetical protein
MIGGEYAPRVRLLARNASRNRPVFAGSGATVGGPL